MFLKWYAADCFIISFPISCSSLLFVCVLVIGEWIDIIRLFYPAVMDETSMKVDKEKNKKGKEKKKPTWKWSLILWVVYLDCCF